MRVALATFARLAEGIPDDAPLRSTLERLGCVVETPSWSAEGVSWSTYDVVVLRSTWDYTVRREDFVSWATHVESETTLCNSAAVVAWNTHKSYLRDLEARGVPIVPTAWVDAATDCDLGSLCAEHGWQDIVIKPAVDAAARGALRTQATSRAGQRHLDDLLTRGDAMVQPYVTAVDSYGERALVILDGALTHAVRKRAHLGSERLAPDDWPPPDAVAIAAKEQVVASQSIAAARDALVDADLLYARVDLVPGPDGEIWLGELELTEPYLFLAAAPEGAVERFADAILERAARRATAAG
ncbi:MAG: hypothetical protein ABR520_01455 [Mycobacteriales bacterium]|nr:hypothetical protein [Frankia sp.]